MPLLPLTQIFQTILRQMPVKSQSVSASTSITLDGDEDQPTKMQKIGSKKVEEIIMGNGLSDLHVNMAQNF